MQPCLVKLTLIPALALLATQGFAQSAVEPAAARTAPPPPAQAGVLKPVANATTGVTAPAMTTAATSGAGVRIAAPAAGRTIVTAAGSVLILADGVVAHATLAQIQPPARGFVYER